jgi:hypothetical protein
MVVQASAQPDEQDRLSQMSPPHCAQPPVEVSPTQGQVPAIRPQFPRATFNSSSSQHSRTVLRSLHPMESARLGRIVWYTKEPHQDFRDPFEDSQPGLEPESMVNEHQDFVEIVNTSRSASVTGFQSRVRNIFSLTSEIEEWSGATLVAAESKTYQMANSGTWFKKACTESSEPIKKWIHGAIDRGQDLYLIVGYRTVNAARLCEGSELALSTALTFRGTESEVPGVTSGSSSNELVASPSNKFSALGGQLASGHETYGQRKSFAVVQEQICSIQYRKVVFRKSPKSLSTASLESNARWEALWCSA